MYLSTGLITLLLILIFTAATVYLQLESQADYGGWIGEKIVQMAGAGDLDSLLVVLFGNLAPVLAALRALRAFGLNPESLMAIAGGDNKAGNRMDPGARQRFAREFDDVSSSLELGRMVIFIDDLDRCRQENVVDILEAVNFLAVSGDCYIVIGMDEKWVRVCIEQQFAQMV
uniref:P-loop NTPase fold protein n=1 Tax=Marinobacterium profundum TaxID=1714300 RepID=UPI00082BD69D|nr:P-loop NTPase fold protein [Marinobacterium profundum]